LIDHANIIAADKIIVLRRGKLVEEGTHEELLSLEDGVYRGLVHAQELALEAEEELLEESVEEATDLQKVKTAGTERSTTARDEDTRQPETDVEPKSRGLFRSVGRLVFEQRGRWALYTFASLGILGAGAVYPIQAWAFAKVIEVFTFTGARFVSEGNFWSGMFGVLAGAVGMSYFVLAFCTHLIAIVSTSDGIQCDGSESRVHCSDCLN
jgi:ABC-type multidrug transport system fused ATPase/permease subunit